MNSTLEQFARDEIKSGLAKLPEKNHIMFKRMYAHKTPDMLINEVVDNMSVEQLDRAMEQIRRTLEKSNET